MIKKGYATVASKVLMSGLVVYASITPAQQAPSDQAEDSSDFLDALITEESALEAATPTSAPPAATDSAPSASSGTPAAGDATSNPEAPAASPAELNSISVESKDVEPERKLTEPRRSAQLEEIVVTATKRAEPLREIPATINVLSGKNLEREGIQSIDQIVSMVPGVNLTDEGTGGTPKRITIRGISAGLNTNLTTGFLVGDVPFTDPFIPKVQLDPNPFDIATVEVLKGPQGTLFGGTGLNGMIRYVPEAPDLESVRIKYYTQLTSYPGNGDSGWNYGAMINAPFASNKAAVRLVGFNRESPGYVDDTLADKKDVNSSSQYGARGILAFQPDDRWKIALMGATQHTTEDDLAYADNREGRLEHGNAPRPSSAEYSYVLGNISIEREFDWGSLISQTSHVDKKFNAFVDVSRTAGGQIPILGGASDNKSKAFIQELRAVSASGDSPWKWLFGAFYYDMDLYDCADIGAGVGLPTIPIPPILNGLLSNPCAGNVDRLRGSLGIAKLLGELDLQEQAVFGELSRKLGNDWELTLGARAYRLQTTGTVSFAGVLYSLQNNLMPGVRPADISEDGISPKASIAYQASDDVRFYVTASKGFRFGGPQLAASTPTTDIPESYQSDSLWNYELGMRSDWLDRTLRIDASLYLVDWTDPQVFQTTPALPLAISYIDNVGGAKGVGAEMSLTYLPPFLEGLNFDFSVAWNRTETSEDFEAASGETIPAGSPWPMSARWQTATTLAYSRPVSSWQAGASVRHAYIGKACNVIECTADVLGYQTFDLNVLATPADGSFWPQVSLTLANLTDERGFTNITPLPEPIGDTVNYIAPRTLVLRLSGSF